VGWAGADAALRKTAGAYVVAEGDRDAQPLCEQITQRNVAPAEVGRVGGDATVGVDDAGDGDAGGGCGLAEVLGAVFADVMAGVRPHVVVADGEAPIREAVASAFSRVRRAAGGTSALPAKLYYRLPGSSPLVSVTTAIAIAGKPSEMFVRAFPDPWVTGVLERDLFAGVRPESAAPPSVEQQLAG